MRKADQTKDVYVLLVEDDPNEFFRAQELLQRIERERYWLVWVASYERARLELDERVFDAALVDDRIGERTGLDFISEVGPLYPHCPMILMTDLAEPHIEGAVERAGAADYLVRGSLTEALLERSIRCARQSAQKLALLDGVLTHAATGMIGFDARGVPVIWNRKALEALGLEGIEPAMLSADVIAEALDRISSGNDRSVELTHPDGRSFEVSHSLMQNGGAVAVLHDITTRVQAEQRLRQSVEEAERASKAKSSFLATMSHELRTPLNGILGMTRVLEGTSLSDLQREGLDVIRSSGATLLDIVNDVLDLSKIEAGHMELEDREIAVSELVDDVVRLLAPTAAEKGVEMAAFVDPRAMATIRGDALRIRQVLTNLVGNAVKFTSAGSILVMVDEMRSADRAMLRFCIVDTGIGIPSAKLDTLFVRFSQADASTAREFGGTGLGLALCKELVSLMGGEISCSSLPDQGSTFCFMLPVAQNATAAGLARRASNQWPGLRILVASPSTGITNVLGSYARAVDGTVAVATSVESARRLSEVARFDAAILDGALGAFGVGEILQKLRGSAARPRRSFLLESSPGQGRELGMGECEVLARPFVRQTFDRFIQQLKETAGEVAAAAPTAAAETSGRRLRILMAEDNPANQRVATALLKAAGFRVEIVDNGRAAIDRATASEFDIILMDVQMPVMDGLAATRCLRERDELKALPIVGLTAGAMEEDRSKCLAAGMSSYLSKPIDWDKLLALLDRVERERYGASANVAAA
jgi:signal transduction histidine kinase